VKNPRRKKEEELFAPKMGGLEGFNKETHPPPQILKKFHDPAVRECRVPDSQKSQNEKMSWKKLNFHAKTNVMLKRRRTMSNFLGQKRKGEKSPTPTSGGGYGPRKGDHFRDFLGQVPQK